MFSQSLLLFQTDMLKYSTKQYIINLGLLGKLKLSDVMMYPREVW